MDIDRARQIASSPAMAHVTYNGNQVYIQQVNDRNGTARIYELKNPDNRQEVPVNKLMEH